MKYEIKITLPVYKIVYSFLFAIIIILVRPIQSTTEIIVTLETYMALLSGIFLADTYYQEFTGGRIACYYRYGIRKKIASVMKRNVIAISYLLVLTTLTYWGFILWYHPIHISAASELRLYGNAITASLASIIFMSSFGFTLTNLAQNMGAGISGTLILWMIMTSSVIKYLPKCFRLFLFNSAVTKDGTLIPYYPSRGLYAAVGIVLFGINVFLIQRQPKQKKKGWKKHGN